MITRVVIKVLRTVTKERERLLLFEKCVMPYMDASYNLAHWIMGNEQDAEDMVQEAYLRAFQFFNSFQGGNARSWMLTIVRNTCYTWLRQNRAHLLSLDLDDEIVEIENPSISPELSQQVRANRQLLRNALEKLPAEFRELIVLRELEGLSYKEIAGVTGLPMGTVMSRLARARQHLWVCLRSCSGEEGAHDL